jgi:hypothetical protein
MSTQLYERSTKMVRYNELSMAMTEALAQHSESQQLTLAEDMPAWLTHSVNLPSQSFLGKLFGRRANGTDKDAAHDVLVVLHPTHLLLVTSGRNRGTAALSVPLSQASVRVGSALETSFTAIEDSGITIGGFPGDHGQAGTFYIGLGPEPAGAECAEAIRAAITDAKNP